MKTVDVGDFQELQILGYDAEGNVFSSLEGLQFEWQIDQQQNPKLEIISLKVYGEILILGICNSVH